jgi:hypothetical protein
MSELKADYLIVGSGAVGMAFADTLINESDATCIIVDRHAAPGGHWNDAYPFVRLHQPSAYYGVNSRPLGTLAKDATGLNKGMYERASAAELLSYYEQVMCQLLATGRVQYFPLCDLQESPSASSAQFVSLLSGEQRSVQFSKKWVDTSYLKTAVPSTHKPKYAIGEGVHCIPLNGLQTLARTPSEFVVIGSGKTGIDACVWLLENGVNPDSIQWIMPRDAWYLNRDFVQPGEEFFTQSFGSFSTQVECVAQAESVSNLFKRLEDSRQLQRLDPSVEPTMYHGAICSNSELEQLRRIKKIIRKGRIKALEKNQIVFENGEAVATSSEALFVDCSASAVAMLPIVPVFEGNKITPQFIRTVQPTFSAALIAYIEMNYSDEAEKNEICGVVPLPDKPIDWLKMLAANMRNAQRWSKEKPMRAWIAKSRLDGFTALAAAVQPTDTEKIAVLQRYAAAAMPAAMKLRTLLSEPPK